MPGITSPRYDAEYAALRDDPIIQDMAGGLAGVPLSEMAHESYSLEEGVTPTHTFMLAANREYRDRLAKADRPDARGEGIGASIGGVAHALLQLLGYEVPTNRHLNK